MAPVYDHTAGDICGPRHLERAYAVARRLGYLWDEFGDSQLIIAGQRERSASDGTEGE